MHRRRKCFLRAFDLLFSRCLEANTVGTATTAPALQKLFDVLSLKQL